MLSTPLNKSRSDCAKTGCKMRKTAGYSLYIRHDQGILKQLWLMLKIKLPKTLYSHHKRVFIKRWIACKAQIMTLYYRRYSTCNSHSVSVSMAITPIQKQEIQTVHTQVLRNKKRIYPMVKFHHWIYSYLVGFKHLYGRPDHMLLGSAKTANHI